MRAAVRFGLAVAASLAASCLAQSTPAQPAEAPVVDGHLVLARLAGAAGRGCELAFRRFQGPAASGERVGTVGSLTVRFEAEKPMVLLLKAKLSVLLPGDKRPVVLTPANATVALGRSLERFRSTQFPCDGESLCVEYRDTSAREITLSFLESWLDPGPRVTVNVKTPEGGEAGTGFALKSLIDVALPRVDATARDYHQFLGCFGEALRDTSRAP